MGYWKPNPAYRQAGTAFWPAVFAANNIRDKITQKTPPVKLNQKWLMAYGLWLIAYGLWLMAYGLWLMAYGIWLMAYGLWLIVTICHTLYAICYMLYAICYMLILSRHKTVFVDF